MYDSKAILHYLAHQKTLTALLLILISFKTFGQVKEQELRVQVLKFTQVGHEFTIKSKNQSTTHLTYLGLLHSKTGVSYKIINSIWVWEQAHRATTRILIFNESNKYIGNYPLTMVDDLPSFIKDNKLVFKNKRNSSDCDFKTITNIDFDNGIPHEFFRKCRGNTGDFYTFDKE